MHLDASGGHEWAKVLGTDRLFLTCTGGKNDTSMSGLSRYVAAFSLVAVFLFQSIGHTAESITYHHFDALGSPVAATDSQDPPSFNRYAYGNNNPYKYIDPDGAFPQLIVPIIIGGAALLLHSDYANAPAPGQASVTLSAGDHVGVVVDAVPSGRVISTGKGVWHAAERARGPSVPEGKAVKVERTNDGLKAVGRPMSTEQAKRAAKRGHDVYTGDRETAKEIAGRRSVGPEIDESAPPGDVRFRHYHPADREGGHIFYGDGKRF